jgi:hypothetical protein
MGQGQQIIMMECMKPAADGPSLNIIYKETIQGTRNATIHLPIFVTSFNEPLSLSPQDFTSRWQQMSTPGLEAIEICSSTSNPTVISGALTSVRIFY